MLTLYDIKLNLVLRSSNFLAQTLNSY